MKKLLPDKITDDQVTLQDLESSIDSMVKLLESYAVLHGVNIYYDDFKSEDEYTQYYELLFEVAEEDTVVGALLAAAKFFYLKGLQDGSVIKENLFK